MQLKDVGGIFVFLRENRRCFQCRTYGRFKEGYGTELQKGETVMKKRKILRTTALALTLSMLITTIPTGIVQASEQSMFDKNGLLTQEMIDKRPQNESEEVQKIITEETEKRDAYQILFNRAKRTHGCDVSRSSSL